MTREMIVPAISEKNTLTRGRTDHFAAGVTNIVSNSGVLFFHAIETGFSQFYFSLSAKKKHFLL